MLGRNKSYSEEEARQLVQKWFAAVQLPVTHQELKSQFRAACKRLHTDISGADTAQSFDDMKKFYDKLVEQNPVWAFSDGGRKVLTTICGTPLDELGLGVSFPKNGTDCPECFHKGYKEVQISGRQSCHYCLCGYAMHEDCNRCGGTGRFKTKGGIDKGKCFACNGSGMHHLRFPKLCSKCHGRGFIDSGADHVEYHVCVTCLGCGEIEIFNPVIPKGILAAFGR
jgi:hypothetical protein